MNLYLVRDGATLISVAAQREDDRFYVFDPHTGNFHRSRALWRDFYADQELTFDLIDARGARRHIAEGVGRYDGRQVGMLLREHQNDPKPLAVEDVLGNDDEQGAESSGLDVAAVPARQRARRMADMLAQNEGSWVTWTSYRAGPETRAKVKARARVAASELRTGKVAAVRALRRDVDAEVLERGDLIEVRARVPPAGATKRKA